VAGKTIKIFFNDLKSYFNSGKYIFLFNLLERLTFFAFYISIARYVDKEIYGFIVTVFTFTNIIATIFDFGIPFYIQRESATNEKSNLILIHSVFIKIISILIFLPLPFIYFLSNLNQWDIILLISVINFFAPVNQVLIFYLNGKYLFKENYKAILISRIPYFLFLIFATLFKINFRLSLLFILLSLITQNILLTKKSGFALVNLLKTKLSIQIVIGVIKKSLPFGLGVIFTMIYDRIDVLLIQKFLSNEAVAIYSAAYSLYRNSSILSGIFLIKVYNDVSKYFITKGKIDFKTFWQTFRILILISLGLILFYNLIGEFLVKLFFTSKFIYSVKILGAVSFALPFIFLNNLTGVTLNSINREKVTMFSTFIGMLVNVATNLLIIPKIGILGAVISTIITEWIILVCQLLAIIFINRKLNNV